MKVFISWSGDKSKALAEILHQWLPAVVQAVKPYYSQDDLIKGARWSTEIARELEESRIGLLILTPENLCSPWILFEAGALSKNLDKSKVCPLLFGVDPTDLEGPLIQFQACRFEKAEMKRVVRMINDELGDAALSDNVFDYVFEMWWSQLKEKVEQELEKPLRGQPSPLRSERALLEEVLALTRSLVSNHRGLRVDPSSLIDIVDSYSKSVELVISLGIHESISYELLRMAKPLDYLLRNTGPFGKAMSGRHELQLARIKLAQFRKASEGQELSLNPDDDSSINA